MNGWRRLTLQSAAFGAGAAIALAALFFAFSSYRDRPHPDEPFDKVALKARYHELTVSAGDSIALHFTYVIENTTDFDYSLKPTDDFTVLTALPNDKGLGGEPISLFKAAYIPAKHKVAVTFDQFYDYEQYGLNKQGMQNDDELSAFLNRRLSDKAGFVLIDKRKRYEVIFPSGWEDAGKVKKEGRGKSSH